MSLCQSADGGPYTVVSLAGQADIGDSAGFREVLELEAARAHGLILDLSGLVSMDWWAALIQLWVRRVADRRGGTLLLASPQPSVSRMIGAPGGRCDPGARQRPGPSANGRKNGFQPPALPSL